MRMRRRQGAEELLAAHPEIVLASPSELRGHWPQPLFLELGCGKGAFICGMAEKYPDRQFVAIDQQISVLSYALDKVLEKGLTNVKLILLDGAELTDIFASGELAGLYLNFSDPWPKKRHAKRRLTSPEFLRIYQPLLAAEAKIAFKTDNRGLFEYSLASLSQSGLTFEQVQLDLHQDIEFAEENVLTEYEQKFASKGPIYRLVAHF